MRVVTPAPRDAWREVLQSDPGAFVYQTPEGVDALCAGRGQKDVSRLYEFDDGRRLILPLYRRRGLPSWFTTAKAPPVGSLVSPGPARPEELRAIFADLADQPAFRIRLLPSPMEGPTWERCIPDTAHRVRRRAHVLDLEGGFEKVWTDRFKSQGRRGVRKAERADLEVERGYGPTLLGEFRDLYDLSVRRWAKRGGEPLFVARLRSRLRAPEEMLQKRMEALGEACRIWIARVNGTAAAAIVVLQGTNAHYTMGAMDKELAGPTRANFLLHKLAIQDACESGCRYYHMGQTGTSDSLARFKAHFGAESYDYHEYRLERFPLSALERQIRGWAKKLIRRRQE